MSLKEWLWSREFYDLMQAYRHTPITPQSGVVEAFEAVKTAIEKAARQEIPAGEPTEGPWVCKCGQHYEARRLLCDLCGNTRWWKRAEELRNAVTPDTPLCKDAEHDFGQCKTCGMPYLASRLDPPTPDDIAWAQRVTASSEAGVARPHPDPQEREEAACAQVLIELAFLLPKGTDVREHSIAAKLVEYVAAIRAAQASRLASDPEIEATWKAIERGWHIEPREYFEKEAPTNGFTYPLAQAIHHLWKRELKEQPGRFEGLVSALRALEQEMWNIDQTFSEEETGKRLLAFQQKFAAILPVPEPPK